MQELPDCELLMILQNKQLASLPVDSKTKDVTEIKYLVPRLGCHCEWLGWVGVSRGWVASLQKLDRSTRLSSTV